MLQVVWFKRDLRLHDHRPLWLASQQGPVLPLFVFEKDYWQLPDSSPRHHWWVCESLRELRESLAAVGQPLVIRHGDIISVLNDLRERFGTFQLRAHQESGNGWTYERDRRVIDWCRQHGIEFTEEQQFGVIRGLRERSGWAPRWESFMAQDESPLPSSLPRIDLDPGELPQPERFYTAFPPGERRGIQTLDSFLHTRGERYTREMSSPLTGEQSCSRISAHLTWGNISMRRVLREARAQKRTGIWKRSLASFDSRLHWHCHFIQKLESEPEIEFRCFLRSMDTMREPHHNEEFLSAWRVGMTGYPFIDACMRYLRETGWLNFRMRSMLVSFAAYDLFLDWRTFGHYLGGLFLDYEPGIHYSQLQMQSGTTGINAIRIYDPVKQSYDQDPTGEFIRMWVPELRMLPTHYLHEPWKLSPLEARSLNFELGKHYPHRVVEHREAIRKARTILTQFRNDPSTRAEAADVMLKHGSKRSGLKQHTKPKPPKRQLEMF